MKSTLSFLILTQLVVPFALIQGAKDKNSEIQDGNRTVSVKNNQEEAEGKEVKAKTHETLYPERKLFKIDLTLEGFLEDSQAKALDYPVEHWQELKVVTAPVLGKEVKRGDLLLRLNLEKIKQEIQRLNNDLAMLDLNREILDTELELAESLAPMKQNEIDRMEAYAKEDLERFKKTDLPFQKKSSQMSLKRQEQYLSYSLEELNQLKKMYEADDLTEETEEIIIQRAQNDVDQAKFYVDSARKSFKEFNEVLVPRSERSIMEAYKRENLSFEALRKIEPAQLKKQRLERKKLEEERKILANRKRYLEKDLQSMSMKSPLDGRLYWGTFERGKWSGIAPYKSKLQKGGSLKPHDPIITISPSKRMRARLNLPEKFLHEIKPQTEGTIKFSTNPREKFQAKAVDISKTPVSPGVYDVTVEVSFPKDFIIPSAGTSCSFLFTAYECENALTLPETVLFEEEYAKEEKYVYLLNKRNEAKKRTVKVGRKSGKTYEILDGISKTAKILKEKPKS